MSEETSRQSLLQSLLGIRGSVPQNTSTHCRAKTSTERGARLPGVGDRRKRTRKIHIMSAKAKAGPLPVFIYYNSIAVLGFQDFCKIFAIHSKTRPLPVGSIFSYWSSKSKRVLHGRSQTSKRCSPRVRESYRQESVAKKSPPYQPSFRNRISLG
jgi:hypothetical protein